MRWVWVLLMFCVSQYQIPFFSHFPSWVFPWHLFWFFWENKQTYLRPLLEENSKLFIETMKQITNSVNTKQTVRAWVHEEDLAKKEHCLGIGHQKPCSWLCHLCFPGAGGLGLVGLSTGVKNIGLRLSDDAWGACFSQCPHLTFHPRKP